MKILQVIHDFLISCKAGSELHTYYLSRELAKDNDVKLFFTIPEDGHSPDCVEGCYDGLPYWAVKKNFTSYHRRPFQERAYQSGKAHTVIARQPDRDKINDRQGIKEVLG